MALPTTHRLNVIQKSSYCPSIGASPVTTYMRVPFRCQIVLVDVVTQGTITTADCSVAGAQRHCDRRQPLHHPSLGCRRGAGGEPYAVQPGLRQRRRRDLVHALRLIGIEHRGELLRRAQGNLTRRMRACRTRAGTGLKLTSARPDRW
jgi:hypothetical protein